MTAAVIVRRTPPLAFGLLVGLCAAVLTLGAAESVAEDAVAHATALQMPPAIMVHQGPALETEPEAFARWVLSAAANPAHPKGLLLVLALISCVWVFRRYGSEVAGWATKGKDGRIADAIRWAGDLSTSDRGGIATVFLFAALGACATSLEAGAPLDGALAMLGLSVGLKAMGGFVGVRKLLAPTK